MQAIINSTIQPLKHSAKPTWEGIIKLLVVLIAALALVPSALADTGTFETSDPLLNQIWQAGVSTANDMLAPGGQTFDAEGRYCPTPAGETVILDGVERDRCPYIGDETVIGQTFDAATPNWDIQRSMLALFANGQYADGAIPSSPIFGGMVLFDYCGYWVTALHNYVLFSGDTTFARQMWAHLVSLIDGWYIEKTGADGLLVNDLGHYDYAFISRHGNVVAYYNAQYVYVLKQAAELAGWLGYADAQQKWTSRAAKTASAFSTFWDPRVGAYTDTTTDHATHPQDGNSFAVLAGIASAAQAQSALNYMSTHESYDYGDSISDTMMWDTPAWGYQSNMRVYPFISFYDVLARYSTNQDASALNLIRREWGYMIKAGPQPARDWETIGPYGGAPTDHWPSWDAGWSSGATPALTQYVLGVRPTSPGYATFVVDVRPSDLAWARGSVITPLGSIKVSWHQGPKGPVVSVSSPPGVLWSNHPTPTKVKVKTKHK